ncbi:YhzD family protein [Jeotgalibacillus sp. ET6]|uniref:YhzD family protein n=1 Tax=Jeotgalibacillus sp. ET6 TaxID=3037260 RepID=UPI002418AC13|nr:YhzD family protein [Jeotgalibacillus sp. ET6]MDG5473399.1 YhzD family protein [Jeotgalibacillus sp. ET6]
MDVYKLTAFDEKGNLLFEDSFQAEKDEEAKEIGKQKFEEEGLLERTHRLVSPRGKLLLFHT